MYNRRIGARVGAYWVKSVRRWRLVTLYAGNDGSHQGQACGRGSSRAVGLTACAKEPLLQAENYVFEHEKFCDQNFLMASLASRI